MDLKFGIKIILLKIRDLKKVFKENHLLNYFGKTLKLNLQFIKRKKDKV